MGVEEKAAVVNYPEWLLAYPVTRRRFCKLCGSPVMVGTLSSTRGSVEYEFEPGHGARYVFGKAKLRMHLGHCGAPEATVDRGRIESALAQEQARRQMIFKRSVIAIFIFASLALFPAALVTKPLVVVLIVFPLVALGLALIGAVILRRLYGSGG